jgi:hypothetical protein
VRKFKVAFSKVIRLLKKPHSVRNFRGGGKAMAKEEQKPKQKPQQKLTLDAYKEETRKRAEEIYKQRAAGNKPGDALSDWLQAEKEIKRKYGI